MKMDEMDYETIKEDCVYDIKNLKKELEELCDKFKQTKIDLENYSDNIDEYSDENGEELTEEQEELQEWLNETSDMIDDMTSDLEDIEIRLEEFGEELELTDLWEYYGKFKVYTERALTQLVMMELIDEDYTEREKIDEA